VRRALVAAFAFLAGPAQADILPVPAADIADLNALIDFDGHDRGPEPGEEYDRLVFDAGASLGAALAGMARDVTVLPDYFGAGRHFAFGPTGRPSLPLRLENEGSVAVARHRGFGSNALFPVGPDGAAEISGRGEGTVAILFDADQGAIGLKIHADYPDPLGTRPIPGLVDLRFWGRDGAYLGGHAFLPRSGINALAFRSTGAGIAAVTVSNNDPGGIALDDILFQREAPNS
jgi:hypothetical protein